VLGLLEVRMSLARVDQAVAAGRRQSIILGALITLLAAGLAGVFVHRIVHRPLLKFTQATRDVARGNLNVELPREGSAELASLAEDFNRMAEGLRRMHAENDRWSRTLERRVAEKTDELEQVYGRMLQIERMASLGQLAATVAHELNNPLSGILTYAKLLLRRAAKDQGSAPQELEFIANETQRCGQIVSDLLLFARRGIGEVADHDLAELAREAIRVVEHHIELHRVTLTRNLEPVTVACDGAQIRQALVALLVNAIEAMPQGGDLEVSARPDIGGAVLVVVDTGMGINPEDRPHIFEPFYTSKSGGKGVGLGLSVVYGIVSRHGGTINVESTPGEGATFTIHLPPVPKVERTQKEEDHA
jgi:two-component system NtrC family sensor kinase